MRWYWNMSDGQAACFMVGQFVAVVLVSYLVCGIGWGLWTSPVGFFVPICIGSAVNLLITLYIIILHI